MKSFKYTINGNVYKVHINSVVDDIADVEVNGTPYQVKLEKPAKKQMVTLKRPAQAPTTASGDPVVTRPAASTTQGAVKTPLLVNGSPVSVEPTGSFTATVSLESGSAKATLVVTAEDGQTKRTYEVNFTVLLESE